MRRWRNARAAGSNARRGGLAMICAALAFGCAAPRGNPDPSEDASDARNAAVEPDGSREAAAVTNRDLRLTLSLVDGPPRTDEPFELALLVANDGAADIVLDFPNAQRYDFEIFDSNGTVAWHWAEDMMFAMVLGRDTIPAGDSLRWTARVDAGLGAGTYRVVATLTAMERESVELSFTVAGSP